MTARKRGSLALPRSPLRGGSGLLARGGNPPHPTKPRYRPSARHYAAPLGSPVPWSRIRFAYTLPLAGASLETRVRVIPCTVASWAVTSHSSRPCGGGSLAPLACTTARKRAGDGVACRGPAGPRGRVPVWPSSAPRLGPRAAMRGGGAQTLQGMRKKCRTAGVSGPPGPLGRASRCPPWRLFRPPGLAPHCPLASVACAGFQCAALHPPAWRAGLPRCVGRGPPFPAPGFPCLSACPPLGFSWRPPPAAPFRSVLPFLSRRLVSGGPVRPAPPLRAAILYRKCSVLEHVLSAVGSRREHFSLALGLVPCAYSFATEKATVCRRSGSTASIPSPGIRRRDNAAPRVLVP